MDISRHFYTITMTITRTTTKHPKFLMPGQFCTPAMFCSSAGVIEGMALQCTAKQKSGVGGLVES